MGSEVVQFAVRHQRLAMVVAIGAFLCLPLSMVVSAIVAPRAIFGALIFLMGVGMLAWGLVMMAAWFGKTDRPSSPAGHGIRSFAKRAFNAYSIAFLIIWFIVGSGLVAASIFMIATGSLPRL